MELLNSSIVSANCSNVSSPVIDLIDTMICTSIAIFGIMGNLFSIAVFHRTHKLRRLTSSVYLVALAVSDTVFLTTLLLSTLAFSLLKMSWLCKSIFYFMNVSGVFSSWLVVLFTVERFVVIYFPINKIVKFSRRRARYLVSILIPIPFLMYVYTAIVLIDVDPETSMCHWRSEYVFAVAVIHSVEICLTYFVPALIVVALNSRIGLKLIKSDMQRQCMQTGSTLSLRQQPGVDVGTRVADDEEVLAILKHLPRRISRSRSIRSSLTSTHILKPKSGSSSSELSATRTLIVISTAFAVLNLPHNLALLAKLIFQLTLPPGDRCIHHGYLMSIVTSVCNALYYANFAVNIVVYHLTSCNYRQGARLLLAKPAPAAASIGRRLLAVAAVIRGKWRRPEAESPQPRGKRWMRRRQESNEKSVSSDQRLGFLHKFRNGDQKGHLAAEAATPLGLQDNEALGLSTIPEADGALTDPKSNPQGTNERLAGEHGTKF